MCDRLTDISRPESAARRDALRAIERNALHHADLGAEPPPAVDLPPHLAEAGERAASHVTEHRDTSWGQRNEFYKLRGRIGEELAADAMPGSVNVNDATGKSNFANYDVVSAYEMASVKVCGLYHGEPHYGNYDKYFRDVVNPEASATRRAAQDMLKLREQSPDAWARLAPHLPPEVAAANPGDMARAMTDKASLRISGDQVALVREHLKQRMLQSPADFGLDPRQEAGALEQRAQRLVRDRIKPIDKDFNVSHMAGAAGYQLSAARWKLKADG